jgi:hypothetical protein
MCSPATSRSPERHRRYLWPGILASLASGNPGQIATSRSLDQNSYGRVVEWEVGARGKDNGLFFRVSPVRDKLGEG